MSDNTGTAAFVGFDTEVAKLTHVLASEAAQIVVGPIVSKSNRPLIVGEFSE